MFFFSSSLLLIFFSLSLCLLLSRAAECERHSSARRRQQHWAAHQIGVVEDILQMNDESPSHNEIICEIPQSMGESSLDDEAPIFLFVYGILETSVIQGIQQLEMDDKIKLTDNISEAHALLALQSKLKKNPRIQAAARSHGIPIYVMKTSSLMQLTKAIRALIADHEDDFKDFESDDKINAPQKIEALE